MAKTPTTYASVNELLLECTVEKLVDSREKFQRQVITIASDVSLAGKVWWRRRQLFFLEWLGSEFEANSKTKQ